MIRAADARRSARLRRVLGVLADRRWHSTREIVRAADVCAVNSIMAELRANGYAVACRHVRAGGDRRWLYRLEGGV